MAQPSILDPHPWPADAEPGSQLHTLAGRAAQYAVAAKGEGTQRAYRSAWRGYSAWCARLGRNPLGADPDTVAMYAVRLADDGRSIATLRVHLAAIQAAHRLAGLALDLRDARLLMVLEGITRTAGRRPRRQAAAATPDLLRLMLAARPPSDTPLGARDRALLLGFGAALRRSELVALRLEDVEIVAGRGVRIRVRRSKTDQRGSGQDIAIWANPREPSCCPQVALEAWLRIRVGQGPDTCGGASDGPLPLFVRLSKTGRLSGVQLSDKAVCRLVQGAAAAADIEQPARFSGHSLRAGLATAAGEAGADLAQVMRQTRHRSAEVAMGYLRPAEIWRQNPTQRIWELLPDAQPNPSNNS